MDWEDIKDMSNSRITFGSMGHRHLPFDELKTNEIQIDVSESFQTLKEHEVPISKVFCYPEAVIAKGSRKILAQLGVRHSVALGEFERPKVSKSEASILGRLNIFEAVSFSVDLFANRLWGVKSLGISF